MLDLKVTQIGVSRVNLSYKGGTYQLSGGRSITRFDATIVRVTTNTGLEGRGESTPVDNCVSIHALGIRAAIAEIAPNLIGLDSAQGRSAQQPHGRRFIGE
ncbi:uncharacterized protein BDV17DRAFT_287063 [Aspergillus undulatus]|uniref:uncharacterized protein n=1 Tax=Aspergillus undulatus TaxID=1810928 RepID=UPI003CCDE217